LLKLNRIKHHTALKEKSALAYGDYRESNNFGESGYEVPWGRSDISVLFGEKSVE